MIQPYYQYILRVTSLDQHPLAAGAVNGNPIIQDTKSFILNRVFTIIHISYKAIFRLKQGSLTYKRTKQPVKVESMVIC